MLLPYVALWFPMVVLAVANGVLRETTYGKLLPGDRAHQVSTATAVILFGLYIWFVTELWELGSATHAMSVGALWFFLTVAFEFLFGHYAMKQPWRELAADWDILQGRLWPLVPLWIAVAPYFFYRMRQ
ncbi:MAG: hypothetical protein ACRD2J_07530 [Thermoanaerobaculia bacterium]